MTTKTRKYLLSAMLLGSGVVLGLIGPHAWNYLQVKWYIHEVFNANIPYKERDLAAFRLMELDGGPSAARDIFYYRPAQGDTGKALCDACYPKRMPEEDTDDLCALAQSPDAEVAERATQGIRWYCEKYARYRWTLLGNAKITRKNRDCSIVGADLFGFAEVIGR